MAPGGRSRPSSTYPLSTAVSAGLCRSVPVCAGLCRSVPVCAGLCRSLPVCALGRLRAGRLGGAGARVEGRVLALQLPELFFLFSFALESALYKQSESAMTTTITKGPKLGDAASLYVSSSFEISKLQAHPHAIPPPSLLAFPHTHHTHLPQLEFHAQSGVDPRGSQDFETLYVASRD
jgi:hypothetical protein